MKRDLPDTATMRLQIREHGGGYALEGPGFYVWDEDREEVLRAARALRRGSLRVAPSSRFLVVSTRDASNSGV